MLQASIKILSTSAEIILSSSTMKSVQDVLELLLILVSCKSSRLLLLIFEIEWQNVQKIGSNQVDNINNDDNILYLMLWYISCLLLFIQADINKWDSFRLIEVIYLCKAFVLILIDDHDKFLNVLIYSLIYMWIRDRTDATKQYKVWLMTEYLIVVFRDDYKLWRQYG